ncbi:MAG: hypothetical protein Q7U04_03550, partial [Bacteriovorax sp.]|nr:hypothetical protein [Bacteriovorax sp.]
MLKPVKILILLFILQLNMHLVYSTELDCNMGYFKGLYACGVLTLQNTVPPIISLASNFCEQQKVANNCNEIVKANPANEKFVVKCDPQSICSRTTYEAISPVNFVIKCLEGAGDFVEDWIKLYEFVAKKKDQRDAFYKVCNKDLACLRAFSRGVPEFDVLSDKELGAFNSVYIA